MKTLLIVTLAVICGILLLLVVINKVFSYFRKKVELYIKEKFEGQQIIGSTTRANFFGEESKGMNQIRGNGALVLTQKELFFVRAMPLKEFEIPIESIKQVTVSRSFNRKIVLFRLLCVEYNLESGTDAIAWAVEDPDRWKASIEGLIKNSNEVEKTGE